MFRARRARLTRLILFDSTTFVQTTDFAQFSKRPASIWSQRGAWSVRGGEGVDLSCRGEGVDKDLRKWKRACMMMAVEKEEWREEK